MRAELAFARLGYTYARFGSRLLIRLISSQSLAHEHPRVQSTDLTNPVVFDP
jgi:hypothetical protein